MQRACKVTLKFATNKKKRQIDALLAAYRSAVNFYIKSLWKTKGRRDADTLARLPGSRLSERYKQAALKQAFDIVILTKKSSKALKRRCSLPVFKGGAILDSRFICLEPGKGSFDLTIKLATLRKGRPIIIPSKHTKMTRKWLSKLGAEFVKGCHLSDNLITLWVKVPDTTDKISGDIVGVDIGVNKLISDSNGNHYGKDFKSIRDKIRRKKPKSKAKRRALKERDNFINATANKLPWKDIKLIGCEDLTNIKQGKKKGRGKAFRKAMAPWTARQVLTRIEQKASENRVRLIKVDPTNTSRTCPSCGTVAKENRKGEDFWCVRCNYRADADYVGAQNILAKTLEILGSLQSPSQQKKAS